VTPEQFDQRMDFLLHSIESHDRQIAEIVERMAVQSANIDKLVQVTNQDADAIRRLAAIAERRQTRLDRIEGAEG
jgi:hypothetical protein